MQGKEGRQCRNDKCLHRKQITSKQALMRKYAAIDFVACSKCVNDVSQTFVYCSMLCLRQDWNLRHWHECSGGQQSVRTIQQLDADEVRKIEKTTPFIKLGQL